MTPQTDLLKLQTEYFWQLPRRQSSPSLILLTETRRGVRSEEEEEEEECRSEKVKKEERERERRERGREREREAEGGQSGRKRELLLLHLCVFHE